jgi:putative Mg2+ transporter-C (MgtC) family protein
VALALGALIGLERQWHHRLAGLRTNALVATGSAAFVTIGALMSEESSPTRIAAQVASGVGFLGAGVILREGLSVRGLDTAATLWCSAAVGSLAGLGFHAAAALTAVAVIATNLCLRPLGRLIDRRQHTGSEVNVEYRISVTCAAADETHVRALLLHAVATEPLTLRGVRAHRGAGSDTVRIEMMVMSEGANHRPVEQLTSRLSLEPSVTSAAWEATGEETDS